jgi:hypothetical protein
MIKQSMTAKSFDEAYDYLKQRDEAKERTSYGN